MLTLEDIMEVLGTINAAYILGSMAGLAHLILYSDNSGSILRNNGFPGEQREFIVGKMSRIKTKDDLYNAVCEWFYEDEKC